MEFGRPILPTRTDCGPFTRDYASLIHPRPPQEVPFDRILRYCFLSVDFSLRTTVSRSYPGVWIFGRTSFSNGTVRSEEHTSELQSLRHLVCRLLLEKNNRCNAKDRSQIGAAHRNHCAQLGTHP